MASELADLIIKDRVRGLSYHDIERKHGVDALQAREMVRDILSKTSMEDEWEQRGIAMFRLEKVIDSLWEGVESGSFKHAEILVRSIDQLSQLLAINKQVMQEQKASITDEQAAIIYTIITENNKQILKFINEKLVPNKKQQVQLAKWADVSADSATRAVETIVYAEEESDV